MKKVHQYLGTPSSFRDIARGLALLTACLKKFRQSAKTRLKLIKG